MLNMCPMTCLTSLTSRARETERREPQEFYLAGVLLLCIVTHFAFCFTSQAVGTISSVPLPGKFWALQRSKCYNNKMLANDANADGGQARDGVKPLLSRAGTLTFDMATTASVCR